MKTRAFLIATTTLSTVFGIALGVVGVGGSAKGAEAAPFGRIVALTAGEEHTCALDDAGAVWCWGSNAFGQLGTEDVEQTAYPVRVALSTEAHVVAVAAGAHHTCAVTRGRDVLCWGSNGFGQIGIGVAPSQATPQLVTLAPTEAHASDVAAGGFTSCVLLSDGAAQCWGRNQYGEVGDWTRTLRNVPTPVIGVADGVDIDAGDNHVCVLRGIGRMQCWGRASDGRIGDSTMTGVAQVSAGGAHSCARTITGGLRCWGSNTSGQLTPNDIDAGITRVAAGGKHTCAINDAATLTCWGDSSLDQLGRLGDPATGHEWPAVADVAAGALHTCTLHVDSSVRCWGHSLTGQAGDHGTVSSPTPVVVIAGLPSQPDTPSPLPDNRLPNTPVNDNPIVDVPVADVPVRREPTLDAPAQTLPGLGAAPSVARRTPSIVRPGYVNLRLGNEVSLVRLARSAGVRLPGHLIASTLGRVRSVSEHPFTKLRVEMRVSNPRNCRNVLTPTLGAAVRATRVGECRVTLRIARAGRAELLRTVIIRTAQPIAVPMIPVNIVR